MEYISGMPKDPNKKRIEVHLLPDDYAQVVKMAAAKDWSLKKFAENIIKDYLKVNKKVK